jgi:endonuclease/exonuclease/phosphatase family metal-dependent hydrolase
MTRALRHLLPLAALALASCARAVTLTPCSVDRCGVASDPSVAIEWLRPAPESERRKAQPWCDAVGPPVVLPRAAASGRVRTLAVIAWNVHEGAGDLGALVDALRSGSLTGGTRVDGFVVLAQEAVRRGPEVPRAVPAGARWAHAIRPRRPRQTIVEVADRLGLSLFYLPSMRNGAPSQTDEDRGNAILSTLPLAGFTAIELPSEWQRRVVVAATIAGVSGTGRPWSLRVVSVHLANIVRHHLWVLAEPGRGRQARALASVLDRDEPVVVGGDLNSWFGVHDTAYAEFARRFDAVADIDRRPTFGPLRLDHLFFRLPEGWRAEVRRADSTFGSDHYPLVATVVIP